MIRNVLEHISGIANYPLVSLALFVMVFAGVLIWTLRLKKIDLEHMRQLPLQDDRTIKPQGDDRS